MESDLGSLMQQVGTILALAVAMVAILALAVAMVAFVTPLFLDLGISHCGQHAPGARAACGSKADDPPGRGGAGTRRRDDDCADGSIAEGGRPRDADLRGDAQLLRCDGAQWRRMPEPWLWN
jgi:hypothetical protein